MALYYLMKAISRIFCFLPRKAGMIFGEGLGRLALLFVPEWRMRMAVVNIEECLGLSRVEAEAVARQSVVKFGRMLMEVLRFPLLTKENIDALVAVEGTEYLEEARRRGKGVIVATAHFGNWELLGAMLALKGCDMLSIARKQNNGAMDRFINEYREMAGQTVAYNRGKEGVLTMGRYLKEKKFLGLLFDQDTNDTGIRLELFGKSCVTPAGAAVFSRTFGCPVLPAFLHYESDGCYRAKIYPPLYAEKTADKDRDLFRLTEQLIEILEMEISHDPAMWFWVHDRWKDGRRRFDRKK